MPVTYAETPGHGVFDGGLRGAGVIGATDDVLVLTDDTDDGRVDNTDDGLRWTAQRHAHTNNRGERI